MDGEGADEGSEASKACDTAPVVRVDDLLVALSTAGHGTEAVQQIRATVEALATTAELEGSVLARSRPEALRLALVVAMRRRNHELSMAPGNGAGEKDLLRTVLLEMQRYDPDAVARLLPLVPTYGSWRDMLLLGEQFLEAAIRERRFPGPFPEPSVPRSVSTAGGGSDSGSRHDGGAEPAVEGAQQRYDSWLDMMKRGEGVLAAARQEKRRLAVELPPEVANICNLFAEQLKKDRATLQSSAGDDTMAGSQAEESKEPKKKGKLKPGIPSNAAKYAPHPNRHHSITSSSRKQPGKTGGGKMKTRNKARHRILRRQAQKAKGISPALTRWICKKLANGVAQRVFGGDSPTLQAQYRRLRSALNQKLVEKGYLVEQLLPGRRLEEINFAAAPSGSLKKYSKAIKKDKTAMSLWRRAMAAYDSAVPKLDDLFHDAREWLEEEDSLMREVMPRAVEIAIRHGVQQREELLQRVEDLMQQVTSMDVSEGQQSNTDILRPSRVLVAVSTSGASDAQCAALLLAALIAGRLHSATHIAVDGQLVAVPCEESGVPLLWMAQSRAAHAAEAERGDMSSDPPVGSPSGRPRVVMPAKALQLGVEKLFENLSAQGEGSNSAGEAADVMFLCLRALEAEEIDPAAMVQSLQSRFPMRSLLLHRLRPTSAATFRPRLPEGLPSSAAEVTVDVCFVMDLTGSMGCWMKETTAHLASIMRELKTNSSVGRINVAFVGYRDYHDNGRVVVKPFVPSSRVEEVVEFIGNESASGGGDIPEDVISGFQAAAGLTWSGHLRFMVLVADAPAHGFCDNYSLDYLPTGLCPDQVRGLKSWAEEIAIEKGVDLLVCHLERCTWKMEAMLEAVYAPYKGCGYGCLPLESGAAAFRDALLGTLSQTLLRVFAPDVPGIQSFDGSTVSSIFSTCMSSLKESIAGMASEAGAASSEVDEGSGMGDGRSDVLRLKAELEAEDMTPVRVALGLPVAESAGLMEESAKALLKAGLRVEEIEKMGYPPEIVRAVKEAGKALLKHM